MTDQPDSPEPPPLPKALLDPRPVIAVVAVAWAIALIAAFVIPDLQSWRPITLAGVGVTAFGTSLYLWQLRAVRRGARGAQTGLQ